MKQELKKEIDNMMLEIPERNRLAINSIKWAEMTEEISKKYYLDDEEKNILLAEVSLVLLGVNNYEFLKIAMEDLGLTQSEISNIFREIEEKIFNPISKKIIDSIKKEAELNNTNWDKRVNFILSGGDYTNFIK
jgi:5'-3' exonuclease